MPDVESPATSRNAPRAEPAAAPIPPDYDPEIDIRKSVRVGFEAIRARVRSGGKGWGK